MKITATKRNKTLVLAKVILGARITIQLSERSSSGGMSQLLRAHYKRLGRGHAHLLKHLAESVRRRFAIQSFEEFHLLLIAEDSSLSPEGRAMRAQIEDYCASHNQTQILKAESHIS